VANASSFEPQGVPVVEITLRNEIGTNPGPPKRPMGLATSQSSLSSLIAQATKNSPTLHSSSSALSALKSYSTINKGDLIAPLGSQTSPETGRFCGLRWWISDRVILPGSVREASLRCRRTLLQAVITAVRYGVEPRSSESNPKITLKRDKLSVVWVVKDRTESQSRSHSSDELSSLARPRMFAFCSSSRAASWSPWLLLFQVSNPTAKVASN
jgi:hypothetical protein